MTPADANSSCAREPITIPGAIQQHGALLAADPASGAITAASRNAAQLLGLPPASAAPIGKTLASLFGEDFAGQLDARLTAGTLRGAAPWSTTLTGPGGTLEASMHHHDGRIIVELETPRAADAGEALAATRALQSALADLQNTGRDLSAIAAAAAAAIRRLTDYERVLIYRFDPSWHGQAIAEDKVADWPQSLNGLHFPASDIPAQARALYRLNPLRWVPSGNVTPVPLLQDPADPRPVDLSFARLRAMSPVHLQYHRNMGVDGAMSLSILQQGRNENELWGLVVCHHRRPHAPSPGQRAAAAVLTDALAQRVGPAEYVETEQARRVDVGHLADLLARMADAREVTEALIAGAPNINTLFGGAGAAVLYQGTVSRLGETPPAPQIEALGQWLGASAGAEKIFHTDNLAGIYPDWAPFSEIASGVLAVFLSTDRADMLLWFRPEEPQLVTWGGNPEKALAADGLIQPRQSFDRWVETRHGVSKPWAEWELEIAESLRHGITDVIVRSLRRISALDEQLRQSQKMEAVGQLTGGLAHDFNNLLTGVIGSLDLMRGRVAAGRVDGLDRYIDNARNSADRAVSLTNRLLAFSRRQTLDPKPVDVTRLIPTTEELISRSVGPAITVHTVLPEHGLWHTICDANQLDNALLNLALNARDAMPDGGHLTIEAANAVLDDSFAGKQYEVAGGDYVVISVTDTGTGMTADVLTRVFEPFFTTKPTGHGTGLGLSMVYGFAKQSNGYTGVYSEPGRGTTVRLYLPRYLGDAAPAPTDETVPAAAGLGETILLVDDEPVVRMLIAEVLGDAGYTVLEAPDGPAGLVVLRSPQHVDLLVTDVGLPGGLNGRQLADAARVRRPELKVLFITGYAENAALGNGLLEPGMQVMTKPFAMDVLTARVRAML